MTDFYKLSITYIREAYSALKVPFFVCLFLFILFVLVFYFIFIYYFCLYLKHFSFIFAAFKKRTLCEFACAKTLIGSSNFGYMAYHWLCCIALVEKTITFKKLNMSIPIPNFTMLWEKLFFFKFVSLEISQYFYEVTKKNFLVYVSGINPISSRAFTTFLYCWGCHRVWVVKSSYLITLEIINQLM